MRGLVNRFITLLVKPHSKQINIKQVDLDTYEVAITSKPEKGKANKEIIEIMAKFLKINKSQIQIIKGHKARRKIIQIEEK